ncbi:hypothetical protein AAD001_04255 [Colwelliaceae bacterium 6471]
MDIFTTQLTRVVQTPIKPASLKVKALLKEARIGKLKADHDHLENHEYYYLKKDQQSQQHASSDNPQAFEQDADEDNPNDEVALDENGDPIHHLDIFV